MHIIEGNEIVNFVVVIVVVVECVCVSFNQTGEVYQVD